MGGENENFTTERLEFGWLKDGKFICDGCGVRDGFEHRCGRDDGVWADSRQVCSCPEPGCFGHTVTWEVVGLNLAPPSMLHLRSSDGRERTVPATLPVDVPDA